MPNKWKRPQQELMAEETILTYNRSLTRGEHDTHYTEPTQIVETRDDRLNEEVLETSSFGAVIFDYDLIQLQIADPDDLQISAIIGTIKLVRV